MSFLQVKVREPEAEVHRTIAQIRVYDVSASNDIKYDDHYGRNGRSVASLGVICSFGSGSIRAISPAPANDNRVKGAKLNVLIVEDDNHIKYLRSVILVQSIEKSVEQIAKPVDQNQIEKEVGEEIPLTSVELDLAVSFDTYFDFNMRSIAGIRSVLNENNEVVESSHDSYRLGDLIPGKSARRTVITNNDFKLSLNIRPTIVKSSAG